VQIEWGGEQLELRPDRSVHWPREATLFIADPHFGKAAWFRQAGVPVPAGTTDADLRRLDAALETTRARRLIVLGDFLHARIRDLPRVLAGLEAWPRRRRGLEMIVVRGNHDRRAGDPPADWGIRCEGEPVAVGPFQCCHEPCRRKDGFVLAGHLHPAIRLVGPDRSSMRVPCFRFRETTAVLPAFGAFTGAKAFNPVAGERVFAIGPDEVVEVAIAR
jgi:DNA ligase-associated metallophosphoesterase